MEKSTIEFKSQPSILPVLYQALFLPRKGIQVGDDFPQIEGKLNNITVDAENLKKYCELCGLKFGENLPPLYPHVLAGVVHLHILTHPKFPLKLLGAVHKYNTINQVREIKSTEKLDICATLSAPRYFPRGLEFDLVTDVSSNSEVVWSEVSTYFVRKRFNNIEEPKVDSFIETEECDQEIASWKLSLMAGKKYAMICKDFNPIHISLPLAKLFGFKKDLVHGMCSAAQCLAKMSDISFLGKSIKIYFKGPSYMGSTLQLKRNQHNQSRYDLFCGNNDRPVISLAIEE